MSLVVSGINSARAPPDRIRFDDEFAVGTVPACVGQAGIGRMHSDDAADIGAAFVSTTFLEAPHATKVGRRERVLQEKVRGDAGAASCEKQGRRADSRCECEA